jgi:hypothetical protein
MRRQLRWSDFKRDLCRSNSAFNTLIAAKQKIRVRPANTMADGFGQPGIGYFSALAA